MRNLKFCLLSLMLIFTIGYATCNNNGGCKPNVEIIGGNSFTGYDEFSTWTQKYTSWSTVKIKITTGTCSQITKYRVSCIKQENYCTALTNFNRPGDIISQFSDTQPKKCTNFQKARSIRKVLPPNNHEFNRDLQSGSGCLYQAWIPYWSEVQWPRNVWVQIIDNNNELSQKVSTAIPVNYTTENPELTPINSWGSTNDGFSIKINAIWATLQMGTSWHNYNYSGTISGLSGRGFHLDERNERLIYYHQ